MLVRDVYLDCFTYEESSLAHYIHHLLAEKKISLDDDSSKIDLNQANHQTVAEMVENNVLGIHKVNIYSLKRNKKEFVFILQPASRMPSNSIQRPFSNSHCADTNIR